MLLENVQKNIDRLFFFFAWARARMSPRHACVTEEEKAT